MANWTTWLNWMWVEVKSCQKIITHEKHRYLKNLLRYNNKVLVLVTSHLWRNQVECDVPHNKTVLWHFLHGCSTFIIKITFFCCRIWVLTHGCEWFHSKTTLLLPQRVEYRPVVPDAQKLVGRRNPVGVGVLGIPEDGVRQPDQADHIAERFEKRKERKRGRMRAGIF